MDGRGRKRKIDEVKNLEPSGLNFAKYSVLVPLLRNHVLSYLNPKTMLNYSQCSNYCNSEVKIFNTKAPTRLIIIERNCNSISVDVSYSKNSKNAASAFFQKTFMFPTFEETMKSVEQYVFGLYRHVKNGKMGELFISLRKWPKTIVQHKSIAEIEEMTVFIRNSMLDDFVKFVNTSNVRVKRLELYKANEQDRIQKENAKQIFSSAFFQQLSKVDINLECEIDDDDFLGFKNPGIALWMNNCVISDHAIRQKISQLNNFLERIEIEIHLPSESTREFNLFALFPEISSERFDPLNHVWCIGHVVIIAHNTNYGKLLNLTKEETVFVDLDNL